MANSDWALVTLGDLIDIKHGFAFKGEFFRDNPTPDILLTPGNFAIGGGFKDDKLKYYAGPVPSDYMLEEGDLIVTMTDLSKDADTLGYPAFVPKVQAYRYLHNQRLGKILIRDGAPIRKDYLYFLLCSIPYRNEVLASATGTTVKHTSPERIKAFKFLLPTLAEQEGIADILSVLNNKIELHHQMNKTLEAIARAIFKSWFVDFDPVRYKIEGREPYGLDRETAALFPSSFESTELGQIPFGWHVNKFSTMIELIGGGTPKTSIPEFWNGTIPWFSVVDVPSGGDVFVIDTERMITEEGLNNSSIRILTPSTTIISARGTVGKCALVGSPMAMNQSCYGVIGKEGRGNYFVYFALRNLVSSLQQSSHGTVFDTITRDTFETIKVACPPIVLTQQFDKQVSIYLDQILLNLHQSQTLTAIREMLLPKLLSGEIRLKDAEKYAEALL